MILKQLFFIVFLFTAATAAKPCPPGNYKLKSGECLPCPIGTFQKKANRSGCKPCPAGKIAAGKGNTRCSPCPKNTVPSKFNHKCVCIDGAVRSGGKCRLCKPGTFFESGPGYRLCSECSSGHFQPRYGQSDCLKCPDGSGSNYGAVECISCPQDEVYDLDKRKCEKCKAGYSSDMYGCSKCGANWYKPKAGNGPCLPCPINTHSKPGAKMCIPCPKGTALMENDKCGTCDPGHYFDDYRKNCRRCGINEFMPYKNVRTSCFACSDKKFALKGSNKCVRCRKNTFLFRNGTCRTCPPGSAHLRDALLCQFCLVNMFKREDMDNCESCPFGTYALPGSTACFTCPKGEALILEKKDCATCPPGRFYEKYSSECVKCEEGYFKANKGLEKCKLCPSNTVSNNKRTECVSVE